MSIQHIIYSNYEGGLRLSDTIRFSMYYSKKLLKEIDEIKVDKGFNFRSQAIIYLIQEGMKNVKTDNKVKR